VIARIVALAQTRPTDGVGLTASLIFWGVFGCMARRLHRAGATSAKKTSDPRQR
jgi:hypothetical protein